MRARRTFDVPDRLFLPATLSLVNTGFMWQLMLSAQFGLVNPLLRAVGLGALARPWLADPVTALPTVILVQAWQWMGLPIVVFLAGLQAVPRELEEAAAIDGTGPLGPFRPRAGSAAGPSVHRDDRARLHPDVQGL